MESLTQCYPDAPADIGVPDAPISEAAAAALQSHRVQIAIRGQRFEMSFPVATGYCIAFRYFFLLPLAQGSLTAEERALWPAQEEGEEGPLYVWEAVVGRDGGPRELSAEQLRLVARVAHTHYRTVVAPRLEKDVLRLLLLRDPPPMQGAKESGEGEGEGAVAPGGPRSSTASRAVAVLARWKMLPAEQPQPVAVEWVPGARQWCFPFLQRLPDEELARHTAALEARKAAAGEGPAPGSQPHASEEEVLGDPFLLLQPDFAGVLLVYVRRLQARRPRTAFPVRWRELEWLQQVRLAQLVRALGAVPLLEGHLLPTTTPPPPTGAGGSAEAAAAADGEAAARPPAEAQDRVRMALGDESLAAPSQGCYKCGLAGHAPESCPYG